MALSDETKKRPKRVRLTDFTCIEEPHPYGVLPGGNRFFGSTPVAKTREELLLDEKLWQQVISFCDGPSHARLVQTSRYLYVVGHQPELWRDQVLRKCDAAKTVISRVGSSWKDTYVRMFHETKFKPHKPMPIPNIYSDNIYRSHLCRSFAIPSQWLEQTIDDENTASNNSVKEVDTIKTQDMTPDKFFQDFEVRNQPVVVKGAANGKAVDKWKDWNSLTDKNRKKSYRSTSGAAPLPGNFSLEAYRDYTLSTEYLEESPLYLFDRTAFATNQEWNDDFFPEFYEKCLYWDPSGEHGHDLLQHLGAKERPDHTWIIMGPKRSGSVFHIDPNATHAWNACIRGRKRWIFYPPGEPRKLLKLLLRISVLFDSKHSSHCIHFFPKSFPAPGVFPSADGDEVALPLSVGEWIIQYWKEHMEQYRKRPANRRPMECTTHPGDVVFVPHGWWHSVINLDESNIAITHNYISPSNLGNALKFFREKQDQISGCRDRKESIKPEFIHDALVQELKNKEPVHLDRAMKQTSWTCRAWAETKEEAVITDDDDEHPNNDETSKNKKRKIDDTGEVQKEALSSVMSKTEKVPAFSFSFL